MDEYSILVVTHAFTIKSATRIEYQVFDTQAGSVYAKVTIFDLEPNFNVRTREILQLYTGSFDSDHTLSVIDKDVERRNL